MLSYYTISCFSELCTIILPWNKYKHRKVPIGLCNSPDIFHRKLIVLFNSLEYNRAYVDDFSIISNDNFEYHLSKGKIVLKKLKVAGF